MEKKKVIIIGGGMSGLCAGCYLQMNGYDTEIFELHNIPGGVCTSWKRKGYTFDGCIHWLVGSSPADPFYNLWTELIDMKRLEFVEFDEYLRFVSKEGNVISLFTDINKLEKELMEKAPEDTTFIKNLIKALKKLKHFEMSIDKAPELMNLLDKIKMFFKIFPFLNVFRKFGKKTVWDLGNMCKNPLLKLSFTYHPLFKKFAALG